MALSPKQNQFVAEYTVDLNATAAAARAGYSEKTAAQMGYKLLKMPEIQKAIERAIADRESRTLITGDMVVQELAKIALSKVEDYYRDYGLEIKTNDKIKALELLGKCLGFFDAKGGQRGRDGGNPLEAILKSTEGDMDVDGIPEAQ